MTVIDLVRHRRQVAAPAARPAAELGAARTGTGPSRPAPGAPRRFGDGVGLGPEPARAIRPRHVPVPQSAREVFADAQRGLDGAIAAEDIAERYATAHLAALRATAAVLALYARPGRGRRSSAWDLLARAVPDLADWAGFFAAGSVKRQAAQAGISRLISRRECDDLIRQVGQYLALLAERYPGLA